MGTSESVKIPPIISLLALVCDLLVKAFSLTLEKLALAYFPVRVRKSVTVPSNAVKRRNGKQTGGRRLALRASLRPPVSTLAWHFLDWEAGIASAGEHADLSNPYLLPHDVIFLHGNTKPLTADRRRECMRRNCSGFMDHHTWNLDVVPSDFVFFLDLVRRACLPNNIQTRSLAVTF